MAECPIQDEEHSQRPGLPSSNPTRSFWHISHPNDLTQHRTTPDLPPHASVVVIGSGISGVFAARELVSSGVKNILVLEARDICSAATGRNGGHCQPLCYEQPPGVADFELQNFQFISSLVSATGIPCDFFQYSGGGCHAYYRQESFAEAKAAVSKLYESSPHLASQISVIEDKARLASLRIPDAVGAMIQANAAGLHPYKMVTWLWRQLIGHNAASSGTINLQTNTPVTSLSRHARTEDSKGSWTIHTSRGSITTPHVLLATNAYTAHLLPEFESLIVPVQGEMSALRPPPVGPGEEPLALQHDYAFLGVFDQDGYEDDYLVQRPVSTGGCFMFGGGRTVAASQGVGCSDDSFCDPRVKKYLRRMLPRMMDLSSRDAQQSPATSNMPKTWEEIEGESTEKDMHVEAEWTGIMGFSRDGLPWVGGVPGKEGLWVCAGYTGHGMPNAPLCGTHVAKLVTAASTNDDWCEVERSAIDARSIPEKYVISKERMHNARQRPEIRGGGMPLGGN